MEKGKAPQKKKAKQPYGPSVEINAPYPGTNSGNCQTHFSGKITAYGGISGASGQTGDQVKACIIGLNDPVPADPSGASDVVDGVFMPFTTVWMVPNITCGPSWNKLVVFCKLVGSPNWIAGTREFYRCD